MNLEPSTSAADALALLPKESLISLKSAVTTAKASAEALKLQKQAQSAEISIKLAPLNAKKAVLQEAANAAKNSSSLVPKDVLATSPELGQLNLAASKAISAQIESIGNLLFDINMLNGSRLSFDSEIAQLTSVLTTFDNMLKSIDSALSKL